MIEMQARNAEGVRHAQARQMMRELEELQLGLAEEASVLEEEAVRTIVMRAAMDKERERREEARERDRAEAMQAKRKEREDRIEAERQQESAATAERERERAAREEARQRERQVWESERVDGQAQQESLQVCADVLGRDLKEREAEIVFLRSEICALENMLQAAFKESPGKGRGLCRSAGSASCVKAKLYASRCGEVWVA